MKISRMSFLRGVTFYGDDDGEGKDPPPPDPNAEKKFTQKDLDAIIDKRFKKERTEKEQLRDQLQKLQESSNLSEQEKQELQQRIDTLNESLQTKEQAAAQALKNAETKYQKQITDLSGDRDLWKGRFVDSTIKRAITDAAVSADAEEPSQLVMMFSGLARLEEEKDQAGKPTGNYIPMMKFQGIDVELKKPALLDLPVTEALQHMKEHGLHKNLFKHGAKPGTGTDASGKGGKGSDPSRMPVREDYASDEEYGKAYQTYRDNYDVNGNPIKKS